MKPAFFLFSFGLSLIFRAERDSPFCLLTRPADSPHLRLSILRKSSSFPLTVSVYCPASSREKLDSSAFVSPDSPESFAVDLTSLQGKKAKICLGIELGTAEFSLRSDSLAKLQPADDREISSSLKLATLLDRESNELALRLREIRQILRANKAKFTASDFWLKLCTGLKAYLLLMVCLVSVVLTRRMRATAKYSHVV